MRIAGGSFSGLRGVGLCLVLVGCAATVSRYLALRVVNQLDNPSG